MGAGVGGERAARRWPGVRAAHAWRVELADTLADLAVTPPQFFMLASLLHRHRRGSAAPTQRRLADESGMDVNTASQVLRGLERRGIVRRERRAQDSRSVSVALTPEGVELAREVTTRARALNREFFAGVDAAALFATLTALAEANRARA